MVDLHTHSTASDGTFTPAELVHAGLAADLSVLALTDHDTVGGIPEFLAAGEGASIVLVAGVEVSTRLHASPIHILGLFIDHHDSDLLALLRQIRANRRLRNRMMLRHLSGQGIELSMEEVEACADSTLICRSHIAQALVARGICDHPQAAFDRYLGRGKPAYCTLDLPMANHAIEAIHRAGGLAVWAHPTGLNKRQKSKLVRMAQQLKAMGLDGLEAYYPYYTAEQVIQVQESARKCGLLVSGGSDFHGGRSPGISLGVGKGNLHIPLSLYATLATAASRSD